MEVDNILIHVVDSVHGQQGSPVTSESVFWLRGQPPTGNVSPGVVSIRVGHRGHWGSSSGGIGNIFVQSFQNIDFVIHFIIFSFVKLNPIINNYTIRTK